MGPQESVSTKSILDMLCPCRQQTSVIINDQTCVLQKHDRRITYKQITLIELTLSQDDTFRFQLLQPKA